MRRATSSEAPENLKHQLEERSGQASSTHQPKRLCILALLVATPSGERGAFKHEKLPLCLQLPRNAGYPPRGTALATRRHSKAECHTEDIPSRGRIDSVGRLSKTFMYSRVLTPGKSSKRCRAFSSSTACCLSPPVPSKVATRGRRSEAVRGITATATVLLLRRAIKHKYRTLFPQFRLHIRTVSSLSGEYAALRLFYRRRTRIIILFSFLFSPYTASLVVDLLLNLPLETVFASVSRARPFKQVPASYLSSSFPLPNLGRPI